MLKGKKAYLSPIFEADGERVPRVTSSPIQRILVVGDTYGVPEILARIPSKCVVGIVAAEIRPQYHEELQDLANRIGVPLLVQPRLNLPSYSDFLSCLKKLCPDSLICHS